VLNVGMFALENILNRALIMDVYVNVILRYQYERTLFVPS
jgi:hypothetical protein